MTKIVATHNDDEFRGAWQPNTFYHQDDMVLYNGALHVSLVDFTSGMSFTQVNWFCSDCNDYPPPINPEQGFDLSIGTPGTHSYVGTTGDTVINATASQSRYCVLGTVSHPHTDTTLRYFEYQVLYGTGVSQVFVGYGLDELNKFVGEGLNAAGYLTGLSQVRMQGTPNSSVGLTTQNTIVSVWTRGQKVWFGRNSNTLGYSTTLSGDPYLDISPSKTLTATGQLRPIVTCLYQGNGVVLNTVGNFVYPPKPSAVAWDS